MPRESTKTTISYVFMIVTIFLTGFLYVNFPKYWVIGLVAAIGCTAAHFISLADDFDALDEKFDELLGDTTRR